MAGTEVAIKAVTDSTVTVAGYGVVFGGRDLDGETFGPETDFMLDLVPQKLVMYDHALGSVKHVIGKTAAVSIDDTGLWVEAELDRHAAYVEQIVSLAERGALGWSSGSVSHLTQREGKSIKRWPVIEFSLTPTPAEPRTLGVEVIKSLAESDDSFKQLLPEDAGQASVREGQGEEPVSTIVDDESDREVVEMSEEAKSQAVDIAAIAAQAAQEAVKQYVESQPVNVLPSIEAPNVNLKTKLGDSEVKALAYYIRTGQPGALKASNDTDLNIGTNADGGYAVPTGHYQGIIARRNEGMLTDRVGVTRIPGVGTTVNVPVDGAAGNVFVSTNEAASFDRDGVTLGQVQMTLVKYTKRIQISYELLQDEDSRLQAFLDAKVGEAMALTHNNALVTEALAGGTSVTLGTAAAANADDIPTMLAAMTDEYGDRMSFVMKRATAYAYRKLRGDNWQYGPGNNGEGLDTLWSVPVYHSQYVPAIGAGNKSLILGNFSFIGLREAPALTFLRDPYSSAGSGQVNLYYYTRFVYKTLQAAPILYGKHPTA